MKIVILHGQNHKGSTYHIARMVAEKIQGDITEFFLPRDFGEFCLGCTKCFMESETKCPHYNQLQNITRAIDESDVIILASPVYVYHATGSMKTFLDHYGYRWMVHRPEASMFKKQGVCISTAAGAGFRSTNNDMADSLFFWGVAKIYKYGLGVAAVDWKSVTEKKKSVIDKKTTHLAKKIVKKSGNITPSIKTRIFFFFMHLAQRRGFNSIDSDYWKEKGWTGSIRPWGRASE